MDDFRTFIEEVKDKADLLQVIGEDGYAFETGKRGRYVYCKHPDSLVVDVNWQQYTWFAHPGEHGHLYEIGDVFDWLQRYRHMEFWDAAVYLAQKYGLRVPELRSEGSSSERARSYQVRADAYGVVHQWLMKQLWATPAALDYCRRAEGGRAWSDETICHRVTAEDALVTGNPYKFGQETMAAAHAVDLARAKSTVVAKGAGLGFAPGTSEGTDELRGLLQASGVDLGAPEAVAMVGLKGKILEWAQAHGIEPQDNWMEHSRIYGLVEMPRLIYPHFGRGGKVLYFSARNLVWQGPIDSRRGADDARGTLTRPASRLVSEPDKKKKSYNPPKSLVGDRMWYFNWLFHRQAAEVVIVEGQADAITLGEWGIAAIGLNGLSAGPELAALIRDVKKRFLALDQDAPGQAAMMEVAQIFGPKIRLVKWGEGCDGPQGLAAGDEANDGEE